jgi:hypothetical protein
MLQTLALLIDDARVVIDDCNMFLKQVTGFNFTEKMSSGKTSLQSFLPCLTFADKVMRNY